MLQIYKKRQYVRESAFMAEQTAEISRGWGIQVKQQMLIDVPHIKIKLLIKYHMDFYFISLKYIFSINSLLVLTFFIISALILRVFYSFLCGIY